MTTDEQWMKLAIETARRGIAAGQTPFGAVIVRDGNLIVAAHNQVFDQTDITAHAEVNAIRQACAMLKSVKLDDCTIYSTCEPCPMCFSACHWAGLKRIVYGASIADAQAAGFSELPISNDQMKALGHSPVEIVSGVLVDECRTLFQQWLTSPSRRAY